MDVNKIFQHNALDTWPLPDKSINCVITSPPYWGLRDYGVDGQLGLEDTPEKFIQKMVTVFKEAWRVLKDDGTLWVNIGDSYAGSGKGAWDNKNGGQKHVYIPDPDSPQIKIKKVPDGLKPKDLVGIPWMLAFALRAEGWYLRQDIIWAKPNCMPESVVDRCTRSHEHLFMFSKNPRYYYDAEAIKEPALYSGITGMDEYGYKNAKTFKVKNSDKQRGHSRKHAGFNDRWDKMTKEEQCSGFRNKRDVWTIPPAQYKEAHFAVFPPALIIDPIKAGCPVGGTVLDPFFGSGTTGLVAWGLQRNYIGFEINPEYIKIAEKRISDSRGLFGQMDHPAKIDETDSLRVEEEGV
jgi:DNA modification methylase